MTIACVYVLTRPSTQQKPAPGSASSSSASPAKQQAEQEVIEVVDAAPQAKVQKGGKTLAALVRDCVAHTKVTVVLLSRACIHSCVSLFDPSTQSGGGGHGAGPRGLPARLPRPPREHR